MIDASSLGNLGKQTRNGRGRCWLQTLRYLFILQRDSRDSDSARGLWLLFRCELILHPSGGSRTGVTVSDRDRWGRRSVPQLRRRSTDCRIINIRNDHDREPSYSYVSLLRNMGCCVALQFGLRSTALSTTHSQPWLERVGGTWAVLFKSPNPPPLRVFYLFPQQIKLESQQQHIPPMPCLPC